jgi:acyl carrier protein
MSTTFDRVRGMLAAEFSIDPAHIAPETPLEELGVDSLAALEFAFELEDEFKITLDSQADLRSGRVCDVVAIVETAVARRETAPQ